MKITRTAEEPLRQCSYLPDRLSRMVYAEVSELSPEEYLQLIHQGWRRFGYWLFRPQCPSCRACEPIRIPVREFKPNRIQRRVIKENSSRLKLLVQAPQFDQERIDLYVAHHEYRKETRAWSAVDQRSALNSMMNFTESPLMIQEWDYYLDEKLVAVAYIDQLPDGYSGIYFYHSPEHRRLSLGNWICISMILRACELGFDYVYFGYYIKGNLSMEYKAAFVPNQILQDDGSWQYFKS